MKQRVLTLLTGMILGAILFGGGVAMAAGIVAQPSWSPIFVDGRQVSMTAYNINGNNYVKLRDIGREVGFNVYYQNGVQVDSSAPYTGEAPEKNIPQSEPLQAIQVSSYKGNALKAGDRSMLVVNSDEAYSVSSSDSSIADVEMVSGHWVISAKAPGTVVISVTGQTGRSGHLALTVNPSDPIDLSANMEIRQEMVQFINQVRRENGRSELPVNEALMNTAQDVSAQCVIEHRPYDHKALLRYGWPHGACFNLSVFGAEDSPNIAQQAVTSWVNSPGHLQTMLDADVTCVGTGVTISGGRAYCYMAVGDPNSHNPYE